MIKRKTPSKPDEFEEVVKKFRGYREPDLPEIIIVHWKPEEPELECQTIIQCEPHSVNYIV